MPYKWRVLLAVCFGTYMATMDFSIVNVALPTFSEEFDRSPDTVVWASLISSLLITGLTLTAGRAGDLYGRKRVYIAGWVTFTAGMATAGFAQGIEQLIAFRALQCVGVALAIANGNAIITDAFPDHERGRALGTVGSVVGAGLMSGPIFGGFILSIFEWPALFYLRVPIGLIAMTLAFVIIRETPGQAGPRRLDVPGAVTLFITLATVILAVNRGQQWGWASPTILGLFAVGAISLALFLVIERREPSPVISLDLFRMPTFAIPVLCLVLNFLGQAAVTFLMPFYLIEVVGHTTAETGLIISSVPLMMLFFSPFSGYVSDRFGFRYQTAAGVALVTLGLFTLSTLEAGTPTALIVARLALVGIGAALFQAPNSSDIMGSVPRSMLGTASAAVATARNVGNAGGLAMASTVLVAIASSSAGIAGASTQDLPPDAILDGVRAGFLAAGLASLLAIVAALTRRRPQPALAGVPASAPAPHPAAQQSITD